MTICYAMNCLLTKGLFATLVFPACLPFQIVFHRHTKNLAGLFRTDCVIGSQVTDNAVLIELSMKAVEEGEFGGETLYGTLQNGVLSAGALNEEIVPVDVQEEYAAYIQQMEDGTFMS